MSIPRDLSAEIPGYGTDKINAAYALGGAKLTLRTVRQLLRHPDPPHRRGQLRRLPARRQPARLRLHRRRPPLLPLERRAAAVGAVRGDQPRAGLPEALRHRGARLRPLPPQRLGLRPRGAPAGLPAPGQGPVRARRRPRRPQGALRIFSRYTRTDIRSNTAILRLLKLAFESSKNPIQEVRFRRRARRRGRRTSTITPSGSPTTRDGVHERQGSKGPARPGHSSAAASRRARRQGASKSGGGLPPGIIEDKREAEASPSRRATRAAPAVYYPTVRLASGGYASGERDYPAARAYTSATAPRSATTPTAWCSTRATPASTTASRARPGRSPPILDSPSDHDARCAAARTSSSTTATACAWSPGARRAASTGSRTRCSQTLTNKQMLAIARSLTRVGT